MIVLAALIAFAFATAATAWFASRGRNRWLVDHPNERSLHDRPVSRAGGIAILAGVAAAGIAIAAFVEAGSRGHAWVLAGALLIACVSLADDIRRLSPAIRIVVHLAAAGCVVPAGLSAERIVVPGGALVLGDTVGAALTVLFVTWLVNLYNFMDGMDGFAGGMATIGFTTLALICAPRGPVVLVAMCSAVAAASFGFLFFNFPPAKIFMGDLGSSLLGYLCAVAIEDPLDREPVQLDWPAIRHGLNAHRIFVTGGGGSIGSELCRQIARLEPSHLVIAEISEYNLHRIHLELRDAFPTLPLSMVLADICDPAAVERIFERYSPEVVFHAAAYKQVPILESHLREAVRVNALGTQTVANEAVKHAAERFVLVSSDKAVDPVNAMGASKRLAEMVCRAVGDRSPVTRFIAVRFGNVLDSAGSVVPLFREQIARGGPVTVTDPEMERYFMTIPEACQLVMASAVLGKGGEVLVLDMGEPVRIVYLAEQMIRLSGKVPGEDVAIEFIGTRPGEKLTEALFHPSESLLPTHRDKILLAQGPSVRHAELAARLAELRRACAAFDEPELETIVAELVPDYFAEHLPARAASGDDPGGEDPGRAASAGGEAAGRGAPENVIPIGQRKR